MGFGEITKKGVLALDHGCTKGFGKHDQGIERIDVWT